MNILYVSTLSVTINSFLVPHIRMLVDSGHHVDVACHADTPLHPALINMGCRLYEIPFSRSPLSKDNAKAYRELEAVIANGHYDIVHCHTPVAAAITRLACRKYRKRGLQVFYTAHGFHFYKGAPAKNWLVYYPVEWLCAHWTDTLITIDREDFALAKQHMHAGRVAYVPGVGIDVEKFKALGIDRAKKRAEIGVPADCTLLLSVGELNENKNHGTVVRALGQIAGGDLYYAIAGSGALRERIQAAAEDACVADRVKLLGFRKDVSELLEAADFYILPSFREGLNVSLMEAMAKGLPCIAGRIRGNVDLIDDQGGVLFDPKSVDMCQSGIERIVTADRKKMGEHNAQKITGFAQETVIAQMRELYRR